MVVNKVMRFQNRNADLDGLEHNIEQLLESQKFRVQSRKLPDGYIIQAQKGGLLSDFIDAERALTITIEGNPDNFTLKVGIGKLIQNLAVMAAEAIILSSVFLVVDIPEMLWTEHIEKNIIRNIENMIS